ncbi:MAG: hypothetical protein OSB69_23435, partial [Alphaproteobacteria bacterium]|nr:hypothetical protein [Alphaproteobacteria bacterium]
MATDATSSKKEVAVNAPQEKSGISINSLRVLTGETVGTLEPASGGFGTDLWRDTPRQVIDTLISLLPVSPASRTILDLRKKLLLTRAAVPAAVTSVGGSLLLRRAQALYRSGDLASTIALLALVPPTHQEEALSKLAADVAFLGSDLAPACDTVAAWVDRSQDRYWQKALVFCEALNGAWERVDFGMQLLIELNEGDEVFFALMRAIGGETDAAYGLDVKTLRPLDVAMARAARAGLPDPADQIPAPWLLRGYIDDPATAPDNRFALVEQAERRGIAEPSELRRVYESMRASSELLENAASVATADSGHTGRALLFRATKAQGSNFGKAQAIKQAGEVAASRGLIGQIARIYAPMVKELDVTSQLAWFAADGALLLLAVGDFEAARPWLGVVEREAAFDPEIAKAWRRTWPLARLVAGDNLVEWRAERLQEWWDGIREDDPEDAKRLAATLFGLLEVLDDPVPSTAWRGLIGGAGRPFTKGPGLAVTRALADAVDGVRVGEAVSLLVIALGDDPLGS